MGKHWIVSGVIAIGFIAFAIGVPSPQVVVWNGWLSAYTQGTVGYFGGCKDSSDDSSCGDFTKDFNHCSSGDNGYSYSRDPLFPYPGNVLQLQGLDQSMCQHVVVAEAFGLLAILFSFFATFASICRNRTHKHAGSSTAFLAALFGIIALAVYFSGTWILFGKTVSQAVNDGNLKLGYSASLQIVGVVFSFFGSLLAAVYTKKTRGIPLLG